MAPITDDTVEALHDTIRKLESRVHQLEAKIGGGDGSQSKGPQSSIRMILMGPPGAGRKFMSHETLALEDLRLVQAREHRHQGSKRSTAPVIW